jgi:hypothetical protein
MGYHYGTIKEHPDSHPVFHVELKTVMPMLEKPHTMHATGHLLNTSQK